MRYHKAKDGPPVGLDIADLRRAVELADLVYTSGNGLELEAELEAARPPHYRDRVSQYAQASFAFDRALPIVRYLTDRLGADEDTANRLVFEHLSGSRWVERNLDTLEKVAERIAKQRNNRRTA